MARVTAATAYIASPVDFMPELFLAWETRQRAVMARTVVRIDLP